MAVNHVQQEINKLDAQSAASQIRPKPGKHHPRETPHQVEIQQAMVHSKAFEKSIYTGVHFQFYK
jgi:hypothetical protein